MKKNTLYLVGSALLCMAISWPMMGFYFFQPNQSMFAYGGDALAIYYNIVYHVCHGTGTHLSSMNYPHGEFIFLTDAQGALAYVLQWIHQNWSPLCDQVLGIANGLNVWSTVLATVLIFLILRKIEVNPLMAAIFAPLVCLLSPPIIRINGHFGLAYPFLLPMAILWYLSKKKTLEWKDLVVGAVLIFFTFNNPYAGTGPAALLLATGVFGFFLKRPSPINFSAIAMGLLAVLPTLLVLKLGDPVTDRIQNQWGFFHYYATLEGLIAPPDSLLDRILKGITGTGFQVRPEARINIGLAATLLVTFYIFKSLTGKIKATLPPKFKSLVIGATAVFIYTTAVLFAPFDQAFVEEKMGFLLMFKAIARLAWPIYFILTLMAVWQLSKMTKNYRSAYLGMGFAIIWFWEIAAYMYPRFEGTVNWNYFAEEREEELLTPIREAEIDLSKYQAIFCLPKTMFWTDNFISTHHFNTQFYAMRISAATGLPLVNAMLSRMSIGQTAEAIELLSHPLIEKSLPSQFPNKEPILVVLGANHPPLSIGEQYLINHSQKLLQTDGFALYELPLHQINLPYVLEEPLAAALIHKGWDEAPSSLSAGQEWQKDIGYFQSGSMAFNRGEHLLLEQKLDPGSYTFSTWVRIDHTSHGVANFQYLLYDETDRLLQDTTIDTRTSNEVHDEWIQANHSFEIKKASKLYVKVLSPRVQILDDCLLTHSSTNTLFKGSNYWLVNGYRTVPEKVRLTTPQVIMAEPK